jgi:2-C-methyl-D-erythritol 4-phosphate cytidylyltransferase
VAVALLLAAGLGERLGLGCPKALVELAGRPLWRWSLDVLLACPEISRVVLAVPAGVEGEAMAASAPEGVLCVPGGAVRSESVLFALRSAAKGAVEADLGPDSLVLVHDAARPLLTAEIVRATLAAAAADGVVAAIAATPVTDTIKQAGLGGGRVEMTLDRLGLWAVQTPQVFRRQALERALDVDVEVLAQATDDAWLIERKGGCVVVVAAPRENLKVTTPIDLELAELLLRRREEATAA